MTVSTHLQTSAHDDSFLWRANEALNLQVGKEIKKAGQKKKFHLPITYFLICRLCQYDMAKMCANFLKIVIKELVSRLLFFQFLFCDIFGETRGWGLLKQYIYYSLFSILDTHHWWRRGCFAHTRDCSTSDAVAYARGLCSSGTSPVDP